jgi:flagellar biosynthesis GTPase FlhF
MTTDEGPIRTVGWGRFALPGERKRLRETEAARMVEMKRIVEARREARTAQTSTASPEPASGLASTPRQQDAAVSSTAAEIPKTTEGEFTPLPSIDFQKEVERQNAEEEAALRRTVEEAIQQAHELERPIRPEGGSRTPPDREQITRSFELHTDWHLPEEPSDTLVFEVTLPKSYTDEDWETLKEVFEDWARSRAHVG